MGLIPSHDVTFLIPSHDVTFLIPSHDVTLLIPSHYPKHQLKLDTHYRVGHVCFMKLPYANVGLPSRQQLFPVE